MRFDFAHDLIRKVCNFSGSCSRMRADDIGDLLRSFGPAPVEPGVGATHIHLP